MNGVDHEDDSSELEFTFVGTGTYLVFWPFLVGALLIGLLIVALILCSATIFQKLSLDDLRAGRRSAQQEGQAHTMSIGGVVVPRGRSDWDGQRSSMDIIGRVSAQ
jgi:hypothetical protein